MIYWIILQLILLLVLPFNVSADDTCISGGVFDGTRCAVDLNGTGDAEDCSELLICKRPDGGQCSGNLLTGYDCSSNGTHYTSLTTCQNSCGGTQTFMCPPDVSDTVCNGTSPLTQLTYRDMYPDDFDQNVTYTYAKTISAVDRTTYQNLSSTYGGHMVNAANYADAAYYWSLFGTGPFFVREGTLYSDALFYSTDYYSCYYAASYDGSQWRPRDYCPGNNCTNYTTPGTYFQRWEKWVWDRAPLVFTQQSVAAMTYQLIKDTYVWDMPTNPSTVLYYKRSTFTPGYDSGTFYYRYDYEHYFNGKYYGEEISCVESATIFGHNVCKRFRSHIYGPIGETYTYDYTTQPYGCCDVPGGDCPMTGVCDNWAGHSWTGPPNTNTSFYSWFNYPASSCYANNIPGGSITHTVNLNSANYYAQHTVDGQTMTTECVSLAENAAARTTVNDCTVGTFEKCNIFKQTWNGSTWWIYLDMWNTTIMNVGGIQHSYYVPNQQDFTRPTEYRDIPLANTGIHQWDTTKCTPCQSAASGVVTNPDDTVVDPDVVPNPNTTCTNFYMFGGAGKKCRNWSLSTLFTDCCNLDGWLISWCNNTERELKKRKQADTCHYVGRYCSKKIKYVNICIEKKKSYCCFNSKLARIVNEQGRPQISKTWGSAKRPRCKGFTPTEFAGLDFSTIDLSEYVADIQDQVDTNISTEEITKGVQDWMINQSNPSALETK